MNKSSLDFGCLTLTRREARLALAALLEWEDANGSKTSTKTDALRLRLAEALFGEHGHLVTSYDAHQLRLEAHAFDTPAR